MDNLFRCTGGGGSGVEDLKVIEREYDEKETYYKDDTRVKNGKLYICLEDDVTGEWDSSKWQETYLTDLVGVGHVVRNATQVINSLHAQDSSYGTYSGSDTFTASQDMTKAKLIVNVMTSLDNYKAGNTGYDFDRIALVITSDGDANVIQKSVTDVVTSGAIYGNSNIMMGTKSFVFDLENVVEGEVFTLTEQFGKSDAHYAGITCVTAFLEYDEYVNSNLKKCEVYYLGTGTSFNIQTLLPDVDYASLTADNFIVTASSISCGSISGSRALGFSGGNKETATCNATASASITKSYNADTGVFTCSAKGSISGAMPSDASDWQTSWSSTNKTSSGSGTLKVYLIIGDIESV